MFNSFFLVFAANIIHSFTVLKARVSSSSGQREHLGMSP